MTIICSMGTKGGTGKSSLIFAMLVLLSSRKKGNFLVCNCDSSSATIPVLIENSSNELVDTTVLNIDDYYINTFLQANIGFMKKYTDVLIDLKGEENREQDLISFFQVVDHFVVPVIPSITGTAAIISLIDRIKALKLNTKKVTLFFNLVGYNESSVYYKHLRETILDCTKGTQMTIIEEPILCVQNIEDKKAGSILSSRKNMGVINSFLEDNKIVPC